MLFAVYLVLLTDILYKETERMCLYLRKGIIKHGKKFVGIVLASVIAFTCVFSNVSAAYAKSPSLGDIFGSEIGGSVDSDYDRDVINDLKYKYYLEQIAEEYPNATNYTGDDIVLKPNKAVVKTKDGERVPKTPLTDEEGRVGVIKWTGEYTGFIWEVNIPQDGFYSFAIEYLSMSNNNSLGTPTRELSINGEVPFAEAVNLEFKKWYVDENTPTKNITEDDVAPNQIEVREWAIAQVRDREGYYMENFRVYLKKGMNQIALNYSSVDMFLGDVIIKAPDVIDDYATVSSQYPIQAGDGDQIVASFQAEYSEHHFKADPSITGWVKRKSSNMLKATANKNTTVTPFESGYTRLNQMGGETNWNGSRDSLTWAITVPEDGLYKIAIRVCNNGNIGMPVYRQIYLDGEIPFSEMVAYKFPYAFSFYTETLQAEDGAPFLFYLTKGTHELRLETVMGELGDAALMFYKQTEELNLIIRAINKILGENPDTNYNYRLETRIPELIPTLEGLIESFEVLIEKLKIACETDSSSLINELKVAIDTLTEAIKDPVEIPDNMGDITGIQTSLGSWITILENSALMIDYFEIGQPNAQFKDEKLSFWKELKNIWDSFIVSFTKDYNAVFDELIAEGSEVVEIWLSRDREYADMMLALMNQEYTADNEFAIKLRIVPGQIDFGSFNLLLLSLMSNQGPDMVWGCGSGSPVNYAIRGVGYDITQFDDYQAIVDDRFVPATMQDLTYEDNSPDTLDGVFGLPETSGMSVAFYRTDIFAELGIEPPKTWDEYFDDILPVFYQENYLGIPSGAGTFLIQMNGWPYRANYRLSGLDSELYYSAFEKDVSQYFIYGIDKAVNAWQGFRDGDVPYMTGSFGTYTQLMVAAPELLGKWAMTALPGMYDELGVLNRAVMGADAGTAIAIFADRDNYKTDEDYNRKVGYCWEIMKWWTSYETQTTYASMVDAKFGQENRWASANKNAFLDLWTNPQERALVEDMYNWYVSTHIVLGSYQQDRYSGFAFNQVVIQGLSARDSIDQMIEYINPELVRKQLQYGITPANEEEIANREYYDISALTQLEYYRKLREEKLEQGNGGN